MFAGEDGPYGAAASHVVCCRQASLGTPIPRVPTVAPERNARSYLASRRSQGASAERRGPQPHAALIDAWRLTGRGRLCFPTWPRQLPDLTIPWCMKKAIITCDRGGRRLAFSCYKWGGGGASVTHLFLACFLLLAPLLAPMGPIRRFSTEEKGKAPRDALELLPPKKRSIHRRDEAALQVVGRPLCEQPPPGYPLPLCAQSRRLGRTKWRAASPTPHPGSPLLDDAGRPRCGLLA